MEILLCGIQILEFLFIQHIIRNLLQQMIFLMTYYRTQDITLCFNMLLRFHTCACHCFEENVLISLETDKHKRSKVE